MEFTYKAFSDLIDLLKENGYFFSNYHNYKEKEKCVIFRHDVDSSLEKALEMAKVEYSKNIKSTYFVLLSTNFYNIFSKESYTILSEISSLGHEIGLHFDETRYKINSLDEFKQFIETEVKVMELLLNKAVQTVSMHRPSKWVLDNDIVLDNIVNSYSNEFFKSFKYVSDSRMNWREDVVAIVKSDKYNRLHILTHPFWYAENNESMRDKLINFINSANKQRAKYQDENFRDLFDVISQEDIL